jgi:dihydroorotate dehydrogenase (fumarate)
MINLETSYMGLKLKNPLIVGSSGLTRSVENIIEIARQGAGAVVLKSLFEEQILNEANTTLNQNLLGNLYPEAEDYVVNYTRGNDVANYLKLIEDSKKAVDIPIIASINCVSNNGWTSFAKQIEEAGADGLELNVFVLPSNPGASGSANETVYFDIAEDVLDKVKIPVALKISYYFSSLAQMVTKLSWTGVKGIVLFNRFFSPDIDIEKLEIKPSNIFSTPAEMTTPLRWIAMLSDRVNCDLAASTGIHDGNGMIKQLLAGAKAVQIASVLYKKGFQQIGNMIETLESWMERKNFSKLEDFVGLMGMEEAKNPAAYERVQFMKHFSRIE